MNPDVFARAEEIHKGLERKTIDNAVLAGKKDSPSVVEDPGSQEYLARLAFQRALMEQAPHDAKVPGPRRRKAPKPDARKRQRQARKAQR